MTEGGHPYRPPRRCGGTLFTKEGRGLHTINFRIPLWGGVANTRNKVAIVFDGVVYYN
ncbi:MAG: hypothetical protein FWH14_04070 [Oscillospiraceae bacterium]|nr:hypothetical protein [Oscillospiraceae bacterium]